MTKLQEFRALLARTLEDHLADAPALALWKLLQEVEEESTPGFRAAMGNRFFRDLWEAIEEGLNLNVRPTHPDDIMLGCGMDDDEPKLRLSSYDRKVVITEEPSLTYADLYNPTE